MCKLPSECTFPVCSDSTSHSAQNAHNCSEKAKTERCLLHTTAQYILTEALGYLKSFFIFYMFLGNDEIASWNLKLDVACSISGVTFHSQFSGWPRLTPSGNNYYIQLNKWQICMPQTQEITKWKTKPNIWNWLFCRLNNIQSYFLGK